jgi:hypothetical protein
MPLTVFQLAVPRENEYTPEAAASLFSSLAHLPSSPGIISQLLRGDQASRVSLEIACVGQRIHFFAAVPAEQASYFSSQLAAAYPLAVAAQQQDYLPHWRHLDLHLAQIVQTAPFYYPLRTYRDFRDLDPMAQLLGLMSQAEPEDVYLFQLVIEPAGSGWRRTAESAVAAGVRLPGGETGELPGKTLIAEKLAETGFRVGLKILSNHRDALSQMAGSFGGLARGEGNALSLKRPMKFQKSSWLDGIFNRTLAGAPAHQILTPSELATLWHLPTSDVKVANITWARKILSEPPDNLPISAKLTKKQMRDINFFGRTEKAGALVTFGIKKKDRQRHMYIIGKTGVGKSTLLENLAISDMKKGEGLAFIDPHGDPAESLLNYIPKNRLNDVIYFNPADTDRPVAVNPLQVTNPAQRELVASGIVSIFKKLYAHSWGPRLEHILRNTLFTLTEIPDTTLVDIPSILLEDTYRKTIVSKIKDPVMIKFWHDEFGGMDSKLQSEAIAPILNKVGQFISSPIIRRVISRPHGTIDIEKIMNEGKILIVNLSQGRLGEDNAALLGAMIITQIQLAAMNRVDIPEDKRRDFYLYVDEFQNFATSSFIKILSEARKFRLCLTLANQYLQQIDEDVLAAILGNAGTLLTMLVGAHDAGLLEKEYGGLYTKKDLVELSNYQMIVKLAIGGLTSQPFLATTLPPAKSRNQNRDKVIRLSREHWGYQIREK